jgi:hypothetical protein
MASKEEESQLDGNMETSAGDSGRLANISKSSSSSSSAEASSKKDIESGRLLVPIVSPVAGAVKAVTDSFLPKIQKVPWIHFFILSFFIAVP